MIEKCQSSGLKEVIVYVFIDSPKYFQLHDRALRDLGLACVHKTQIFDTICLKYITDRVNI